MKIARMNSVRRFFVQIFDRDNKSVIILNALYRFNDFIHLMEMVVVELRSLAAFEEKKKTHSQTVRRTDR